MSARFLCGFILAALCACGQRAPDVKVAVGRPVPELGLVALADGRQVTLSDYKGRSVILNVWATWCEPCRREMPSLQALAARGASGGPVVVGVTLDSDYNLAREFLLRHDIRFPNLVDPGGKLTGELLGVKAVPETFVIAGDGRLAARFTGPRDWASEDTSRVLEKALAR